MWKYEMNQTLYSVSLCMCHMYVVDVVYGYTWVLTLGDIPLNVFRVMVFHWPGFPIGLCRLVK